MKLMNVNLYIYLIYLYLAKIMSDSYMKKKKKKNNDIDEYIKQDINCRIFWKKECLLLNLLWIKNAEDIQEN